MTLPPEIACRVRCWRCPASSPTELRTDGLHPLAAGWRRLLVSVPDREAKIIFACPEHVQLFRAPALATEIP